MKDIQDILEENDKREELLPDGTLHFYNQIDKAVYGATSQAIAKLPLPESLRHLFMRVKTSNGFYMVIKKSEQPPSGCVLVDPDAKIEDIPSMW